MNHLAHALLAETAGVSIAGSFAGDFVRGRLKEWGKAAGAGAATLHAAAPMQTLSADLLEGVRFHRAVDSFTDAHPIVMRATRRFTPPHRRWAGVIVDVWFDHLLAARWREFHEGTLEAFAARVNEELRRRRGDLPPRSHPFLDYLLRENLLVTYREEAGALRALAGLSRRVGRENPLATAGDAIGPVKRELAGDFGEFMSAAVTMARGWKRSETLGRASHEGSGPEGNRAG